MSAPRIVTDPAVPWPRALVHGGACDRVRQLAWPALASHVAALTVAGSVRPGGTAAAR